MIMKYSEGVLRCELEVNKFLYIKYINCIKIKKILKW